MTFEEFRQCLNSALIDMNRNPHAWGSPDSSGKFEQHWYIDDHYRVSITFILDIKDDNVTVKKVYDNRIYTYRLPDIKRDVWNAVDYDNEGNPYLSETDKRYEKSRARTTIEDTIKILDTLVSEYKSLSKWISNKNTPSELNYVSKLIDNFVNKLLQLRPKLEKLFKLFEENRAKSYGRGKY